MGEIIGRCVSTENAIKTLTDSQQFIPPDHLSAYIAALNRARYELQKNIPVKPLIKHYGWFCGKCGFSIQPDWIYCRNCGKEILK